MSRKPEPDIIEECEDIRRRCECHYDLGDLEREYKCGDGKKGALPLAVAVCLRDNIEVPEWARDDFCLAVLAGKGPWEQSFGHRRKDDGFSKRHDKFLRQIKTVGKDLFNWIE